jgi:hypothetical protein
VVVALVNRYLKSHLASVSNLCRRWNYLVVPTYLALAIVSVLVLVPVPERRQVLSQLLVILHLALPFWVIASKAQRVNMGERRDESDRPGKKSAHQLHLEEEMILVLDKKLEDALRQCMLAWSELMSRMS